jgi:hypothetical protein
VAGSAIAAGLVLGGCPAYGVPPRHDARPDVGATDAYGIPMMDALPDTGSQDAEPTADASVNELDDGGVFLYGVPPAPEDEDPDYDE